MIVLIPMGNIDRTTLEALRRPLQDVYSQRIRIGDSIALPRESWNEQRRQYLASRLLAELPSLSQAGDRVLGVAEVDIFAPGLNFVFGQADIAGKTALISLRRLRQEFYGLPLDEDLFGQRALKETVHELGHTYGLGHCPEPTCAMLFSNSLGDTDLKGWSFCLQCQEKVKQKV